MSNEMQKLIDQEIRTIIPAEKMKQVHLDIYEGLTSRLGELVVKRLPEDQAIEFVDNRPVIQKKKDGIEGFDKLVEDASAVYVGNEELPSFSEYVEKTINETHWKKFLA